MRISPKTHEFLVFFKVFMINEFKEYFLEKALAFLLVNKYILALETSNIVIFRGFVKNMLIWTYPIF